ncbi:MAG: ABC transporter permease [Verrucomicrobia bacterium]|nr:ABC transporter permease [Verrucomicrobiota bacterium]
MFQNPYTSQVQLEETGDILVIRLMGVWVLDRSAPSFDEFLKKGALPAEAKELMLETKNLEDWDSSLLVFLNQAREWADGRSMRFNCDCLPDGLGRLMLQPQSAVDSRTEAKEPEGHPGFAEEVGKYTITHWRDVRVYADFLGEILLSGVRLIGGKARMRWVDCFRAMQDTGPMALPIVGLISFLIGVTLAFQAADLLKDFGSEYFTPAFVGLAMVREMGPIMTGIVLAGRTGAAFASTIGSMKVAEEIDALRTMGVSPVDYLVLPRVIGLSIMTPLMVIYADALGILGGMLVSKLKLNMPIQTYVQEIFLNIDLTDICSGLLKSAVFGMIIAYSGCLRGMNCDTSSTGVGRATTSAVVTSLLLIIISNSIFAVIYSIYNI